MSEKKAVKRAVLSLGFLVILLIFVLVVAFFISTFSHISAVQVSPLTEQMLVFNLDSGQKFTGSLAISGGSSEDIDFRVVGPQGATIVNLGRVSHGATFEFTAQQSGAYTFHFGNSFSLLGTKTVSLTYKIGIAIFGIDLGFLLTLVAVVIATIVILLILLILAMKLRRRKQRVETNQPHPPPKASVTEWKSLSQAERRT
jgi:hypothetical protein